MFGALRFVCFIKHTTYIHSYISYYKCTTNRGQRRKHLLAESIVWENLFLFAASSWRRTLKINGAPWTTDLLTPLQSRLKKSSCPILQKQLKVFKSNWASATQNSCQIIQFYFCPGGVAQWASGSNPARVHIRLLGMLLCRYNWLT
jgi:hypothetical protein